MRLRVVRAEPERVFVMLHRLLPPALTGERDAPVVRGGGDPRIDPQRVAELRDSLLVPALLVEHDAEARMGYGGGRDGQRAGPEGLRVAPHAHLETREARQAQERAGRNRES